MPGISRDLRDLAFTRHGCTPVIGVKATQGSVFANGSAILRPGDPLLPHTIEVCCPARCVGHPAVVNSGSFNVFVEGRPVARRFDSADFGFMIGASANVFANGS
jgi:uncharacterized Zn-binding protein involved in type VI secretion